MALLSGTALALSHGQMEIFSGVDFEVGERARIGIVGPNGGGKTSLLRIMVGEQEPTAGTVHRARGVQIGYVPQAPGLSTAGTLRDEVMTAFDDLLRLEREMQGAALRIEQAAAPDRPQAEARYAALAHEFEARGGYTYQNTMERTVAGLGLSEDSLTTPAASVSGGERTRAALAKALLADPDVLVLDEPTNHLDLAGLTWLERFLARSGHAFVVVSHDRYFLDRVVTEIWEMDNGRLRTFPGNYSKYRVLKAEQELAQGREYERQQEYIAKEEEFIRRYGAGQRAREAQGRATRLARLERVEAPPKSQTAVLTTVSASRTAQVVLRTRGLKAGFVTGDERVTLLTVPDVEVSRGARIAVMGGNGAGKTTLIRTLLGPIPPVDGSTALGGNVKPGYYRQGVEDLPDASSVMDALLEVKGMPQQQARAYLARFLFRGDDVFQTVDTLSGGQRSRVALARLLVTQPNLLVLDEPTNHLDIPSREALEQVLVEYDGTLLLVSHDRQLVSLLAQEIWIAGEGVVKVFRGGFEEWVRQKEAVPPPAPRAREPARHPPPKRRLPKQSRDDPERAIAELEAKLKDIEAELQAASAKQDIGAISRLGQEHAQLQALLDRKWAEWVRE